MSCMLGLVSFSTKAMTSPSTVSRTIKVGQTTTLSAKFSPGMNEAIKPGSYRWESSEPYSAAILESSQNSTCVITGKTPTLSTKGALITCTVSYYQYGMTGTYPTYEYSTVCYFYVAVIGSAATEPSSEAQHDMIIVTYRAIDSPAKHNAEVYSDQPHTILSPEQAGLNYDASKYQFKGWQDIKTLKTYRVGDIESFKENTTLDPIYSVVSTEKPSQPSTGDTFSYQQLSDQTAQIIGYSGSSKIVKVPSKIDGYTITDIGSEAFKDNDSITQVQLPDTIEYIGASAFNDCDKLEQINLPDNLKTIAGKAFYDCDKLLSITIPESVKSLGSNIFYSCGLMSKAYLQCKCPIPEGAFRFCYNLKNVTLADGISIIGYKAFDSCAIENINFPDSITYVGMYAFDGYGHHKWYTDLPAGPVYIGRTLFKIKGACPESVSVKEGTVYICCDAFAYDKELKTVYIPASLRSVGVTAFVGCDNLQSVYITDLSAWCKIVFNDSQANPIMHTKNFYLNDTLVTELTVPDDVESIGENQFYNYEKLTEVTIPYTVKSIGKYAFGYYSKNSSLAKLANFTIYGYENTEAQRYAAANNITFVSLGQAPVFCGDVDRDYSVTILDVTIIQKHLASIPLSVEMNSYAADADGDEVISILDATAIQRWLASFRDNNEIGKPLAKSL